MRINIRNDIIFFFIFLMIEGTSAFGQMNQNFCAVKVYVNDPYAKIYVDNIAVGSPPQIIDCSQKEKTITVKSADGQIFSRLIKANYNDHQSNSMLNVIFHKKLNQFIDPSVAFKDASAHKIGEAKHLEPEDANSAVIVRDMAALPDHLPPTSETKSTPVVKEETPVVAKLSGFFVQIFALKNLDLNKVEKDIQEQYQGKVIEKDMVVCSRRGSSKSQITSLILVGPFADKASAFEERNRIGGKSFVVSDLHCFGEYQKVSR